MLHEFPLPGRASYMGWKHGRNIFLWESNGTPKKRGYWPSLPKKSSPNKASYFRGGNVALGGGAVPVKYHHFKANLWGIPKLKVRIPLQKACDSTRCGWWLKKHVVMNPMVHNPYLKKTPTKQTNPSITVELHGANCSSHGPQCPWNVHVVPTVVSKAPGSCFAAGAAGCDIHIGSHGW